MHPMNVAPVAPQDTPDMSAHDVVNGRRTTEQFDPLWTPSAGRPRGSRNWCRRTSILEDGQAISARRRVASSPSALLDSSPQMLALSCPLRHAMRLLARRADWTRSRTDCAPRCRGPISQPRSRDFNHRGRPCFARSSAYSQLGAARDVRTSDADLNVTSKDKQRSSLSQNPYGPPSHRT